MLGLIEASGTLGGLPTESSRLSWTEGYKRYQQGEPSPWNRRTASAATPPETLKTNPTNEAPTQPPSQASGQPETAGSTVEQAHVPTEITLPTGSVAVNGAMQEMSASQELVDA